MKIVILWLFVPLAAWAQSVPPPKDYTLLGAGIRTRPEYDGSNSQRTDIIPVVRYYGRPWFARTSQGILEGGARWKLAQGFDVGAQLAYEAGREAKNGLPELDWGTSIGLHAEYERYIGPVPIDLLARLRQYTDSDRGTQADLRLTAGVYSGHGLLAGVFGQATWANAKSNRSFYAVNDGGLLFTSIGILGSYDLARHWVMTGSLEGRRLRGDAARSPITERTSNHYASVGLAYRF